MSTRIWFTANENTSNDNANQEPYEDEDRGVRICSRRNKHRLGRAAGGTGRTARWWSWKGRAGGTGRPHVLTVGWSSELCRDSGHRRRSPTSSLRKRRGPAPAVPAAAPPAPANPGLAASGFGGGGAIRIIDPPDGKIPYKPE